MDFPHYIVVCLYRIIIFDKHITHIDVFPSTGTRLVHINAINDL